MARSAYLSDISITSDKGCSCFASETILDILSGQVFSVSFQQNYHQVHFLSAIKGRMFPSTMDNLFHINKSQKSENIEKTYVSSIPWLAFSKMLNARRGHWFLSLPGCDSSSSNVSRSDLADLGMVYYWVYIPSGNLLHSYWKCIYSGFTY